MIGAWCFVVLWCGIGFGWFLVFGLAVMVVVWWLYGLCGLVYLGCLVRFCDFRLYVG